MSHHEHHHTDEHQSHEHHHGHHDDHAGHIGGHGSAKDFLRRFWVVTILLVPLVLTNSTIANFLGIDTLGLGNYIQFGIATLIFAFSLVFFEHAWHEIKARQYGMMTLVSIAVLAGYVFSVVSTFLPTIEETFYLEISTLIWVLLFGHYLEAKAGTAAGDALEEVAKLLPKRAHLLRSGEEIDVEVSELAKGDVVIVKPGERVPADGSVLEGSSSVNESLISGESQPVYKGKESSVVAGSIVEDGALTIRLTGVGEDSTVGQVERLIREARNTKPEAQRVADRAAGWLTLIALIVSLLTFVIWSAVVGESFVFAMTLAITVLVITCPHALGLAIPAVTSTATSLALKSGMFIKDLSKLEVIKDADYVVFDKTGTLTTGQFGVEEVLPIEAGMGENRVLEIAASLENSSSHIIGISIVRAAEDSGVTFDGVSDFKNIAGKGVQGVISGTNYVVGNVGLLQEKGIELGAAKKLYDEKVSAGKTVVLLANESNVIGLIVLSDTIRSSSKEAVEKIKSMGVSVAMLTGDNTAVAKAVAQQLGIDTYYAEVLPEDKYKYIKELQEKGSVVLMVGDGVNDAPSLAQSDAGIAIGAGTDVAVESGDVVLTKSDPLGVAKLIYLSRRVYGKMVQNLWWALGYNIVAIPAAAGVFAAWGFLMRPEIGALLMGLSTVIVVINALTLRNLDLSISTYTNTP